MFRGLLTAFIVFAIATALILYAYGRKTVNHLSTVQTDEYVDLTTISPAAAEAILMKNWIDYVPPSKKFSAKFPISPQHGTDRYKDSKTNEVKQYEMYISESNNKVFMISVIAFLNKESVQDEELILRNTINDMISSNPGNKLEKMQFGSHDDKKTADFMIDNDAYTITGRAFINGNHLYVLSTLSKTPEEAKTEFEYFVKSFKLMLNEPKNLTNTSTENVKD